MTDLIPPPATARVRVPLVDPATVLEEEATGTVDLGPDWSALRAFAGVIVALAVAALVGHRVAGSVGVVIAGGLVALVLFVAAHVRAWALGRRLDRTAAAVIDAYEPVAQRLSSPSEPPDVVLADSSVPSSSGRNDLPGVFETGSYASTGTVGNRSAATPSAVYVWRCDVCRVVSIEASTRPEMVDLAGTHDRLHHGRPTAVLDVAGRAHVSMLSTREGL